MSKSISIYNYKWYDVGKNITKKRENAKNSKLSENIYFFIVDRLSSKRVNKFKQNTKLNNYK